MKAKFLAAFGVSCVAAMALILFWPATTHLEPAATPFVALGAIPVPEIPARAAELVHFAPEANREETAREVIRAVGSMARPGTLPFVVSAISRSDPDVSGAVVGVAAKLQPEDVLIFCKAALTQAPGNAYQVVNEACQAAPAYCAVVAIAASKQLPSAKDLILAGFANARPELEPFLEKAEIQAGPDFEAVIKQTIVLVNQAVASKPK